MATNPRTTIGESTQLTVVSPGRRSKRPQSNSLNRRLVSTAIALLVLGLVLRYLPSETRRAQARTTAPSVQESPSDLRFSGVQISRAPDGEAVYVDGLVTNEGSAHVSGATAQVDFYDSDGAVIANVQQPLVGMAHGGTDLVRNEFARNPIGPKEMRFFRLAVENVPPTWNHELPQLKIIEVKAK